MSQQSLPLQSGQEAGDNEGAAPDTQSQNAEDEGNSQPLSQAQVKGL